MPLISYNKSVLPLWRFRREAQYVIFTALLIFITILHSVAAGGRQTITLSVNNVPLEKVFKEIQKQSGYSFIYTRELLHDTKPVSVKVSNVHINEAIALCLKEQPVTFSVVDKMVIIKPKREVKNTDDINKQLTGNEDPGDISGRVTDAEGKPLAGANVKIKGTNIGTVTDKSGHFTLHNVDGNASLEISFVGHDVQIVTVKGKQSLSVILQPKNSVLDETVVIAYGTTTRRWATGNVGSVKSVDIEKQPVNNPILALQGRVPGLTVIQSTGNAGSGITIRIQGRNNLNSSFTGSDPLIVIDGMPYPSQNLISFNAGGVYGVLGAGDGSFNRPGSTMSFINPSDIESIDVLKDADATAIYGSRAANGAILITTKKGSPGDTKVGVNIQSGWGNVSRKLDLLKTPEYLDMRREAKRNDNAGILPTDYDLNGLWDATRYTDWQKELIGGTAKYNRITASVSGGTTNLNFLVGGTYSNETTVFPGDFANTKGGLHFNINSSTNNKRLQFQFTGSFIFDQNDLPGYDLTQLVTLPPVAPPLYNEDGTLNWAQDVNGISSWTNPLSYINNQFENKSKNIIGNAIVSYRLFPNLEFKGSLGFNQLSTDQFLAAMDGAFAPEKRSSLIRTATFTNNMINSWIFEPQLSYKLNIGSNSKFDILLGSTFQEKNSDGLVTSASGQTSDVLMRNRGAATSTLQSSNNAVYRYSAIFGRINYILNSRYLLNLSARRDGSSRFGSNNLFQNFGAIGIGWIFNEEPFIKNKFRFLSFGKLRGSYGITGNDQIKDYQFMSLYSSTFNSIPYQTVKGLESGSLVNPNLQWEETVKLQGGVDLGIFKDKVFVTVNYFRNRTSNTLSNINLPSITGTTGVVGNFPALIQNTGWEFALKTDNVKSKVITWTTNFNLTIPRNKLVSFPELETSSSANLFVVGQPLSISKTYSFFGVDPLTGEYLLKDAKGNVTDKPVSQTDRISIINNTEQFFGGLQNTISYKSFQLDFFIQFTKQKGLDFFQVGIPGLFTNVIWGNELTSVLNRWQKSGDITGTRLFTTRTTSPVLGDRSYRDISFARLKNASLSYQIPKSYTKKVRLKDGRIFINAQNIFTITRYQGLDPETKSIQTLPPIRMITVGAQLGF